MSYLVDSDYVADWLKGKPEITGLLRTLAAGGLAISIITYGEIYEGIYYGRDPRTAEQGFLRFLRHVDVLPLHKPIMKRFAQLSGQLRSTGMIIGAPDILIGATALHYGLTMVTGNIRHFERLPGLALYAPTAGTST
jgi:predicted nucleic acid-binding protein